MIKYGAIAGGVVLVGVMAYFALVGERGMFLGGAASQVGAEQRVRVDGTILKNKPGFKPDVWYLSYEYSASMTVAELQFDDESICAWLDKSGRCRPSVFIQGRSAHIEGTEEGSVIRVDRLTFTEPPRPSGK